MRDRRNKIDRISARKEKKEKIFSPRASSDLLLASAEKSRRDPRARARARHGSNRTYAREVCAKYYVVAKSGGSSIGPVFEEIWRMSR